MFTVCNSGARKTPATGERDLVNPVRYKITQTGNPLKNKALKALWRPMRYKIA